ncbi:MAG: YccF domain-containing protein [Firmicutes bacterium]|nr:YccF domain-containing protein [Bacillota bacterium]MCL1953955.1 YccF domain-containing protein [Bacillota bacterium]
MNVIWLIFGGLFVALAYFIAGIIWCITIIGIPFGLQSFKFASLSLAPFGRHVDSNPSRHIIANVIWLILFGWYTAIGFLIGGILICITIVGIPFGLQLFKYAKLALMPFGAEIH